MNRDFGTHLKLFLGVNYSITVELSSPKLCAYTSLSQVLFTFFNDPRAPSSLSQKYGFSTAYLSALIVTL